MRKLAVLLFYPLFMSLKLALFICHLYSTTVKRKYTPACIQSHIISKLICPSDAPAEFILVKALMPNVEGKNPEKIFQNVGMLTTGHGIPDMNKSGSVVNRYIRKTSSLS